MLHVQLITRSLFISGLMTLGAFPLLAKPVSVSILTEESAVEFNAVDTRKILSFKGVGKGVVGKFKITDAKTMEGQASFPLKILDTDVDTRNEHMLKLLDVTTHPDAKFVPTSLPWADPSQILEKAVEKAPFEGKMTIRGVEKAVQGTVDTVLDKAGKVNYTFAFNVLLSDFGMEAPSFLGVKVDNTIGVIVKVPSKVEVQ
jgi:polyisoprenoid-binding protein YceI